VATVCVREMTYQVPYGVVRVEQDSVVGIEEKPTNRELINGGIYVLDPSLLARVPSDAYYPLTSLIAEACTERLPVKAFVIEGQWMDIGHLEDYDRIRGEQQAGGEEPHAVPAWASGTKAIGSPGAGSPAPGARFVGGQPPDHQDRDPDDTTPERGAIDRG
jgi:NDP-sugar pyrophosphorylase family protein